MIREPYDFSRGRDYRAYVRTLIFVYTSACYEHFGQNCRVQILHSLDSNLYSEIRKNGEPIIPTEEDVRAIREKMDHFVGSNTPVLKSHYPREEAMEIFHDLGRSDQEKLFHYRAYSNVNLYSLDEHLDYFYGRMLPQCGLLHAYDLVPYKDGMIIRVPVQAQPDELQRFTPKPKLFSVFQESREWGRIAGVENIGQLNECICNGEIEQLMEVSEALHARNIADIAKRIAARTVGKEDGIKLVLVAGPSSSGKTTFSQKLCIQLMAEGLSPHLISMDNFFKNREDLIPDEEGIRDFESLDAVDLDLLETTLQALFKGQTVEIPKFNFKTGIRESGEETLRLGDRDIIVMEGIHGLNDAASSFIPRDRKFKVYISPLTMISIDDHNRIPTTDGRLLRRMVRDYHHRGYTAAQTIAQWPSVRAGEEKNIFPYQEEADVMFNSVHIYELAVLKTFAEPLLFQVTPDQEEYEEARRLIKFLSYVLGTDASPVPRSSILREFIGGGRYHQ